MPPEFIKILKGAKVISPKDNLDDIFDIKIENGIIVEISKNIDGEGEDLSGKIITPGLIDMHCHLREPGFEYKETIESGLMSAKRGGFSAVCPMANTNPVIDNIDILSFVINKSFQITSILGGMQMPPKIYQICAITKNLEGKELVDFKALKKAGAIAFSDDGKPLENIGLYKQALKSGELIISHAEDSKLLTSSKSEWVAVKRELEILKEVGGRIHFAHLSTKESIDLIRNAKKDGLSVTCETAPHYFTFTNENVTQDGRFKMNPPLRTKEDLDAVIEGLKDGTIDCIATDHAPHSLEEKLQDFNMAPFGIVGFETAIGASLKLVQDGYLTYSQLVEKLSTNPTKILGLKDFGHIKKGQKANVTIIDPEVEYTVDEKEFVSKCKISPFNGLKLKGKVVKTIF